MLSHSPPPPKSCLKQQYNPPGPHSGSGSQRDYYALRCVFEKIKEGFPDKRIGFPMIGAGLAGGDWSKIKEIIKEELHEMHYLCVKYVQ